MFLNISCYLIWTEHVVKPAVEQKARKLNEAVVGGMKIYWQVYCNKVTFFKCKAYAIGLEK